MSPAEDIISTLPEALLNRILIDADLDIKSLAQTSILSTRWRNLWKSSLTKLNFHNIPLAIRQWNSFAQFVENVLSLRNCRKYPSDLDTLSLTADGILLPRMFYLLEKIFLHGVENRVRTFRFAASLTLMVKSLPGLSALYDSVENLDLFYQDNVCGMLVRYNFSALRTLRLSRCVLITPVLEEYLEYTGMFLPIKFEVIPNMNKLELIECWSDIPVEISCGSELLDLVIVCPGEIDFPAFIDKMMISAPRVKSFTCKDIRIPLVESVELPCLEFLDIDVFLYGEMSDSLNREKPSLEAFRFFRWFSGVKRMKLHHSTITVLIRFPDLLEMEKSPFKSMYCVEFYNSGSLISNRRNFNALIRYLFNVDDGIRGTTLFDRIFAQPGASEDSSSRPVVVYKSDLA